MNQSPSYPISMDSRSAGLARVCLVLAETESKARSQCRNQGKTIGANLNRHPLAILSLTKHHARPGCASLQSP